MRMRTLGALLLAALASAAAHAQTKPAVLPAWAQTAVPTTDILQPSNTFITAGWPLSSTPPSRQTFNWVLNYATNGVRYFSRRGIADWDTAETYLIGDLTTGPDGLLYRSLLNANVGNTPASSPSQWGSPLVPTAPTSDNSNKIASTAFVKANTLGTGTTFANIGGQIAAAQVPLIAVKQWQGNLLIGWNEISGFPASVPESPNTYVQRDGSGGVYASNFNQDSVPGENPVDLNQILVTTSVDGYFRKASFAFFQSKINLANLGGVVQPGQLGNANTPAIGDSSSRIATTAFANPSQSLATNGHVELPGGFIMQWGVATFSDSTNPIDVQITFPITFPHQCFGVFPSTQRSVAANGQAVNGSNFASSITTNGAILTIDASGGGVAVAHWLAIGN